MAFAYRSTSYLVYGADFSWVALFYSLNVLTVWIVYCLEEHRWETLLVSVPAHCLLLEILIWLQIWGVFLQRENFSWVLLNSDSML